MNSKEIIQEKILSHNLRRLRIFALFAIPAALIHIIIFYNKIVPPDSIEYTWKWGIIISHFSIILLFLLTLVISIIHKSRDVISDRIMRISINSLIFFIIIAGVCIAIIDQFVTSSITPFLLGCTLASLLFLVRPVNAFLFFLFAFLMFIFLMPLTQSDPDILLSNNLNGFSVVVAAFLLSYLMWKNTHTRYEQAIIIEEQKMNLEHRNRDLTAQSVELQNAISTKDKFFSIIAHDLKSPFNSIIGFSEILIEQVQEKDYEGIEDYAKIIQSSSRNAMNLLVNLMEWSRSQTGRMEFNPEYFEFISQINETVDLFTDIAGQKSIEIKKSLPSVLPVFADKAMISTVMRNLISNAIKFTSPGGEINISSVENQNKVSISVSDNGVGIPPENIKTLFRLDQSITTPGTQNERGTGLGLILCKEFIEKHGGKISIESEAGEGSKFTFSIHVNPPN